MNTHTHTQTHREKQEIYFSIFHSRMNNIFEMGNKKNLMVFVCIAIKNTAEFFFC